MLRNVSATGVLSGSANVGGLVGSNTGTIVNANARVTVTGQSGGFFIGGLVGNNGSQGCAGQCLRHRQCQWRE